MFVLDEAVKGIRPGETNATSFLDIGYCFNALSEPTSTGSIVPVSVETRAKPKASSQIFEAKSCSKLLTPRRLEDDD